MSRPQQARAVETRRRILLGAAEAFSANGYDGTTIADILATSGVTKGSLYFHFESKEDLGRAIVVQQTEMVSEFAVDPSRSAAQQIIDLSLEFGRALQRDALIRASVRMTTEGHGFDREQRIAFDRWLSLATDMGTLAIQEGSIQESWSAQRVARTLTAVVNGSQQSSLIYSDYADILERLTDAWTMLSPGLFTASALRTLRLPT